MKLPAAMVTEDGAPSDQDSIKKMATLRLTPIH
jgi:hypothetical protein